MTSTEFRSSVDLSKVIVTVKEIDPSVDRCKYTAMKECLTCNTPIGKSGSKKFYCHFCYSAVCGACSPLNVIHPETRKEEKICNPCYINYLKLIVLEVGEEYVKYKLRAEIEEKEREIKLQREVAEELVRTKSYVEEERQAMVGRLSLKGEECKKREEKAKEVEEENKRLQMFLDDLIKRGKIDNPKTPGGNSLKTTPNNNSRCMDCIII